MAPANARPASLRWMLGIGCLSASALGLEIALTRVFGVLLQYHYVSLVVSLAVLGIGIGGYAARALPERPGSSAAGAALATGLYAALLSFALARYPYVGQLPLYALAASVPFVLFGWCMGKALSSGAEPRRLYAADLLGAALGVAAAYGLLQLLGGLAALFALAAPAFAAALLLPGGRPERRPAQRRWTAALLLAAVPLVAAAGGPGLWQINFAGLSGAAPDKTIVAALRQPGAELERSYWDAFARADVVGGAEADRKTVFVDGGAGSYMYRYDGNLRSVASLAGDIEFLPFAAGPAGKTAIVGSGGGRDILYALLAGAKSVTAVEMSGSLVQAMREDEQFGRALLAEPGVEVVVGDGRSVLERSDGGFDLIALDLVYSQVGGTNGHALSENYAFTREAFQAYMQKLNENGRLIVVSHQGIEGVRAFYTALAAHMELTGAKPAEAVRHAALLLASPESKSPGLALTVLQRQPLQQKQLDTLLAGAQALKLQTLFLPGSSEQLLKPLIDGAMPFDRFVADSDYNVYPTVDDRPFFYLLTPGLPASLRTWLAAVALLTALLGVWIWRRERALSRAAGPSGARADQASLLVAVLAGAGYMLLQAALIQKALKYAGSPALAAAIVLAAMLAGGSLGSRLAGRRLPESAAAIGAALLIAALTAAEALWGGSLTALPAAARLGALGLAGAAIGLLAGVPLPQRLAVAERRRPGSSPLLFAVSGIAGLWGSWLGAALALTAGLRWTLAAACLCYLLLLPAARFGRGEASKAKERGGAHVNR
ncbi:spermidine synthase [Paenibacillus pasadenensis]|nr:MULTISPECIES: class I SAM-dependent methyltransferase [Paenibacillus]QGG56736.1 hypothetical protein GE073_14845 [Paenibacillus sp. B01]